MYVIKVIFCRYPSLHLIVVDLILNLIYSHSIYFLIVSWEGYVHKNNLGARGAMDRISAQDSEHDCHNINRRTVLRKLAAGMTALLGLSLLPEKWTSPVIGQVVLPAHAQTSGLQLQPGFYQLVESTLRLELCIDAGSNVTLDRAMFETPGNIASWALGALGPSTLSSGMLSGPSSSSGGVDGPTWTFALTFHVISETVLNVDLAFQGTNPPADRTVTLNFISDIC